MMSKAVLYYKEDSVIWIIFNRPEAQNGLNYAMTEELEEGLNQTEADREVRVAILIGQG
jgi:enoyl-CoA hydratase/carnithine racemase